MEGEPPLYIIFLSQKLVQVDFSPNFACEWGSYLCLKNCPWIPGFLVAVAARVPRPGCLSYIMLSMLCWKKLCYPHYAIYAMLSLMCDLCYLRCAIFAIQSMLCNIATRPLLCYLSWAIFAMLSLLCYLCCLRYAIFAMLSVLCGLCYAVFALNPGIQGYLCWKARIVHRCIARQVLSGTTY